MTNHEINRAIAEACGWRDLENEDFSEYGVPCFILMGSNNTGTRLSPPDYCHDLNAMHEAEKTLGDRLGVYRHFLALVAMDDPTNQYKEPAFTTALQRSEAFLRVIGEWVDSPEKEH